MTSTHREPMVSAFARIGVQFRALGASVALAFAPETTRRAVAAILHEEEAEAALRAVVPPDELDAALAAVAARTPWVLEAQRSSPNEPPATPRRVALEEVLRHYCLTGEVTTAPCDLSYTIDWPATEPWPPIVFHGPRCPGGGRADCTCGARWGGWLP